MLVFNIGASLIAFLAFVGFRNSICGELKKYFHLIDEHYAFKGSITLSAWLGYQAGLDEDLLTFEFIIGKLFIPVAFIMGVPWEDCENVGQLIGLKTIVNEFAAYQLLGSN